VLAKIQQIITFYTILIGPLSLDQQVVTLFSLFATVIHELPFLYEQAIQLIVRQG